MVIPDEVKQQLLYHYPKSKFKVSHGLYYGAELEKLGTKQFFLLYPFSSNRVHYNILHVDGSTRTIRGNQLNLNSQILIKSITLINFQHDHIGYLIEII